MNSQERKIRVRDFGRGFQWYWPRDYYEMP